MGNPLHQFELFEILKISFYSINLSFTNSSLFMLLAVVIIGLMLHFGTISRNKSLLPGKFQALVETTYDMIHNMISDNIGHEYSRKFFPLVYSLFMFVLITNLLGMFPKSLTVMSHIIVTFTMAASILVFATLLGFYLHGFKVLKLFVPSGVPKAILPLVTVIEIISYFSRAISLSVRLFANMLAGHTMLKIFLGFIVISGAYGIIAFLFSVAITGFEVFVAFIQSYIFTVLTCVYIGDTVNLH